jgi:hypothetical protein
MEDSGGATWQSGELADLSSVVHQSRGDASDGLGLNILLIGDSRDRFLYHEILEPICRSSESRETPWWNPSKTPHSVVGSSTGLSKQGLPHREEVRHGITCAPTSPLSSIGFLLHFGVFEAPYFRQESLINSHEGWDGPGWSDKNNTLIDSPALILEAARRFLFTARCDSRANQCVVVFSSMLQDIARHCMFFPSVSLDTWSSEFSAQFLAVASGLSKEVEKTPGAAQLVLVAGYPTSEKASFQTPWSPPGGLECHTQPAFQRASNIETQHVAMKLGVPFVQLSEVFAEAFLKAPPSTYLRDRVHANIWGLRMHWSALRAVFSGPSKPPSPPAPITVVKSSSDKGLNETPSSLRLNILLVGDSRDRYLYHEILQPLCGSSGRPTAWWNPSKTQTFNSNGQHVEHGKKNIFEVRHGQTCDSTSSLGSIGYMAHYGVANDHYIGGYHEHGHEGWDGPGWSNDEDGVNSPALIVEATRRFLDTSECESTAGGSCVVLFSSMVWDLARHCHFFPEVTEEQWGKEFMAQYSSVTLKLQDEIHRPQAGGRARLFLTTGYLTTDKHAPYTSPDGADCHTPLSFERTAQVVSRNVSAQLYVPILDFAAIFDDLFPSATSIFLRDNIHANLDGLKIQWAAIRAAVEETLVLQH